MPPTCSKRQTYFVSASYFQYSAYFEPSTYRATPIRQRTGLRQWNPATLSEASPGVPAYIRSGILDARLLSLGGRAPIVNGRTTIGKRISLKFGLPRQRSLQECNLPASVLRYPLSRTPSRDALFRWRSWQ